MSTPHLECARCGQPPEETHGWIAHEQDMTADQYVWEEEGTLDRATGKYLCDYCFFAVGMPTSKGGWKATPENLIALAVET